MLITSIVSLLAVAFTPTLACDSCYGPSEDAVHVRHVKRMQPDAQPATDPPKGPLSWGQLNFIHTTDTHGWLEGHLKEENYGADWGDFKSFAQHMRAKATALDVDLLVLDTGDLHDGAGLSDAESPDGVLSNPIFENVNYDLLTIGNHELYLSDIAYLTATQFAKHYGDKYLTSNVQIFNNETQQYEYIGKQYRYFTTPKGIRIMAMGFLYDFTGNSNASKVIKAADAIKQPWFSAAVNYTEPIDLFILMGHNPLRKSSGSTLQTIFQAIRAAKPNTPIQVFGGHTHVRDFAVYDAGSTGIESGRYCETLGWVSMSGINSSTYNGTMTPKGVPNPTHPANSSTGIVQQAFQSLKYFRRYIDWNRLSFAYHAVGSQSSTFNTSQGVSISNQITTLRNQLNLTALYGCAPQTWCIDCLPFGDPGNIYSLLQTALAATVINDTRKDVPRLIILNTGSVRFDLVEGPFTFDDSFIVSPFTDTFQFLPNVPYENAKQVVGILDNGAYEKRSLPEHSELSTRDFGFSQMTGDQCVDASKFAHADTLRRRSDSQFKTRGKNRLQKRTTTPGYTTTDDLGTDGDDTLHTEIPFYSQPNDFQANASFPTNGSLPETVDLIFLDFIAEDVLPALAQTGINYTMADVQQYLPPSFDTNAYLPAYAKIAPDWQKNVPNCPVGLGVGYNSTNGTA